MCGVACLGPPCQARHLTVLSHAYAAGCFIACLRSITDCDWATPESGATELFRGVSVISRDAGLTWQPYNVDGTPELQFTNAMYATAIGSGSQGRIVCRIGGFVPAGSKAPEPATGSVACSRDGYAWYSQLQMPEGRALGTVRTMVRPGETSPRWGMPTVLMP